VVSRSFALDNITVVQLRAERASCARVVRTTTDGLVTVSGQASGGAGGYHGAPDWKETPASEWGLSFEARRHGPTLVVSTQKEISYIHHYYYLDNLVIHVPNRVSVVLVPRYLDGDGASDLEPMPRNKEPKPEPAPTAKKNDCGCEDGDLMCALRCSAHAQ
jgi:hypothetical protein